MIEFIHSFVDCIGLRVFVLYLALTVSCIPVVLAISERSYESGKISKKRFVFRRIICISTAVLFVFFLIIGVIHD